MWATSLASSVESESISRRVRSGAARRRAPGGVGGVEFEAGLVAFEFGGTCADSRTHLLAEVVVSGFDGGLAADVEAAGGEGEEGARRRESTAGVRCLGEGEGCWLPRS